MTTANLIFAIVGTLCGSAALGCLLAHITWAFVNKKDNHKK
jgi:hypothetical protein